MLFIAHRGNVRGPSNEENAPWHVEHALAHGFDVEVDVWVDENTICLGHDEPEYHIDMSFLSQDGLWCHAKNAKALSLLLELDQTVFYHQEDNFTITSNGYIWSYPGCATEPKCIAMEAGFSENVARGLRNISGVCSDYIWEYRKWFDSSSGTLTES